MRTEWVSRASLLAVVLASVGGCAGAAGPTGLDHHVSVAYTFPYVATSFAGKSPCTRTYRVSGRVEINYTETAGFRGDFRVIDHTRDQEMITGDCGPDPILKLNFAGSLSGTANAVRFQSTTEGEIAYTISFAGALTGGVIDGTITFTEAGTTGQGVVRKGSGSGSISLR